MTDTETTKDNYDIMLAEICKLRGLADLFQCISADEYKQFSGAGSVGIRCLLNEVADSLEAIQDEV